MAKGFRRMRRRMRHLFQNGRALLTGSVPVGLSHHRFARRLHHLLKRTRLPLRTSRYGKTLRFKLYRILRKTNLQGRSSVYVPLFCLVFVAALIGLLFHLYSPTRLDQEALDCAQVGRNIAAGHGFAASIVRPIQLSSGQSFAQDVYNPPLYPFLLGWVFLFTGASDAALRGVSYSLFILAAALLFFLALRLSGSRPVAILTGVVFALSLPVLRVVEAGNPLILAACLLLGMLLVITPADPDLQLTERQQFWRPLLAGILSALCYLTDYATAFYVAPLALLWCNRSYPSRRRVLTAFALGFVVTSLFWWIRNLRLTGNPFYTLQWLEFVMHTRQLPGLSLYRDTSDLRSPLLLPYLIPGGVMFFKKLVVGLMTFYNQLPSLPHPYLFPFVLGSYWLESKSQLNQVCKSRTLPVLVLAVLGMSALGRASVSELVPLTGLLAYIGVAAYHELSVQWCSRCFRSWVQHANSRLSSASFRRLLENSFSLGLSLVLSLPFFWQLAAPVDVQELTLGDRIGQLRGSLPASGAVITDIPWEVAWYANRPAIWIPNQVSQLQAVEKGQAIAGLYLSPGILSLPPEEPVTEWQKVLREGSELKGYLRKIAPGAREMVYVKLPSVEDAQRFARSFPKSAEALIDLAGAQLREDKPQEAVRNFLRAQQLMPGSPAPYEGAGMSYVQLKDYSNAIVQFSKALRLSPHSLAAEMGLAAACASSGRLAQAIALYEQMLADDPGALVAVNNLAVLYAETGQNLNRALEMARRAVQMSPNNGAARDTLGWVCYHTGRSAEALAQLREAAQILPGDGLIQYHLAKALLAAGQKMDAAIVFRKAIDCGLPADQKHDAQAHL